MFTADTSFVFSLYGADVNTASAKARMADASEPLVLTGLHRFELGNALRLAVYRGILLPDEAKRRLADFDADVAGGLVVIVAVESVALFNRASVLSESHTAVQGQRSMDILLVATAMEMEASDFLSFDDRQRALAEAEGLRVGR